MPHRVIEVLSVEEAFTKGMCPHCAAPEPDAKIRKRGTGDWLEGHLKRCKARPQDLAAATKIQEGKRRWAVHDDCGRVMVLCIRDGLVLIENSARRYVVPARDLAIGSIGTILELIEAHSLSSDEIQELIGHLLTMTKEVSIKPAVHAGNRVEFRCGGVVKRGRVKRRHGKHSYIIEPEDGTSDGINISKKDIVHVIE